MTLGDKTREADVFRPGHRDRAFHAQELTRFTTMSDLQWQLASTPKLRDEELAAMRSTAVLGAALRVSGPLADRREQLVRIANRPNPERDELSVLDTFIGLTAERQHSLNWNRGEEALFQGIRTLLKGFGARYSGL
ncbi:MAG: hypothetical protein ACKVPX_06355 [Myxococcaceae bacterium]